MLSIDEVRHLADGPRTDERPTGAGLATVGAATEPAASAPVLERVKEVLSAVLGASRRAGDASTEPAWPTEEEWATRLPAWFVAACPPEQTPEEQQAWLTWWRTLDAPGRAAAEASQPWSLSEWLYWLNPEERQWFWWDGRVVAPDRLEVVVEVQGWPAPVGALSWLLRAAGASRVEVEEGLA